MLNIDRKSLQKITYIKLQNSEEMRNQLFLIGWNELERQEQSQAGTWDKRYKTF